MHHPSPDQVHAVADLLSLCPVQEILMLSENCDSTFCHAVAYHFAHCQKNGTPPDRHAAFAAGAVLLAVDLGFASIDSLTHWADTNPQLWGNTNGGLLLISATAFVPYAEDEKLHLEDLVSHWRAVAKRLTRRELSILAA